MFVIGLLVLGPQRLPKVAAEIGKWVGRARRTADAAAAAARARDRARRGASQRAASQPARTLPTGTSTSAMLRPRSRSADTVDAPGRAGARIGDRGARGAAAAGAIPRPRLCGCSGTKRDRAPPRGRATTGKPRRREGRRCLDEQRPTRPTRARAGRTARRRHADVASARAAIAADEGGLRDRRAFSS